MASRTRNGKQDTSHLEGAFVVDEIDLSKLKGPRPWDIEASRRAVLELMKRPATKKWLKDMAER